MRGGRLDPAVTAHLAQGAPVEVVAVIALLDLVLSPAGLGGYTLTPRTGRIDDEDAWEWAALHIAARALYADAGKEGRKGG